MEPHRQAQQAALLGDDTIKDLDILVQTSYSLVHIVVDLLCQCHLHTRPCGRASMLYTHLQLFACTSSQALNELVCLVMSSRRYLLICELQHLC